jgi:hypothetical protein
MTPDTYEYGDSEDATRHGLRELLQLQVGLMDGALTQAEYAEAEARIREEYGIPSFKQPVDANPGP